MRAQIQKGAHVKHFRASHPRRQQFSLHRFTRYNFSVDHDHRASLPKPTRWVKATIDLWLGHLKHWSWRQREREWGSSLRLDFRSFGWNEMKVLEVRRGVLHSFFLSLSPTQSTESIFVWETIIIMLHCIRAAHDKCHFVWEKFCIVKFNLSFCSGLAFVWVLSSGDLSLVNLL